MILLVCVSRICIAFSPPLETLETRETRNDIFARSESHFPQNSSEKNCETRLAVNPLAGDQIVLSNMNDYNT
jgi:hypothetical protein